MLLIGISTLVYQLGSRMTVYAVMHLVLHGSKNRWVNFAVGS